MNYSNIIKSSKTCLIVSAAIVLIAFSKFSYALEALEIVEKAIHATYYPGLDGKAKVDMKIYDKQGRIRTRNLTMLRSNLGHKEDKEQKYYVFFNKPSDVKKMVFMAWKNIDKDDDRWLYLPALDLVKRIAASDERTSFVGSHFFYEDVSGRRIDEDVHSLVDETDEFYVINSAPKDPDKVEFKSYKNWVDKNTFLPMKAEYYNSNDKVYRSYIVKKTRVIDGYPTVIESEMVDNINGGKTTLNYSGVKYTLGLPDKIFSERFLRRPARKYLR